MPRKTTIHDVARAAGTSASTVSRVLTGNARVGDEKRRAVEEAIARLGFRPSHIARSLKTKVTYTVGLLINDIMNPFYSAVARGAEEEANRHGYSLILCNTGEDPQRELHYLGMLRDKQVDGIIFGPTSDNVEHIRELARLTPLVQVDRALPGLDLPTVLVDNEGGACEAVRLLLGRGHQRIGLLTWDVPITSMAQRQAGYERALREAGLVPDPRLVAKAPPFQAPLTCETAEGLLARAPRPTALFALNNQLGMGALQAIRKAGLRMPQDVALVIFDDLDFFALATPSITAVSQPAFALGECAMQYLIAQIEKPGGPRPRVAILPTELVLREST